MQTQKEQQKVLVQLILALKSDIKSCEMTIAGGNSLNVETALQAVDELENHILNILQGK